MVNSHPHHPPTLRIFFTTEMWERYGFYVVQTLLALYLALHFQWTDKRVYGLVGSFTALTYLSPVIGGWIADHLLGQKRAILTGAVILLCSYLAVMLSMSDEELTASLAAIAVGTGLLKPNISSLLGNEYPIGSPNRESGFTIFYIGITTGILLGTTIPSYLNTYLGWSASFLSAAIGLIIAIGTFSYGISHYKIQDYHAFPLQIKNVTFAVSLMVLLWLLAFYILHDPNIANTAFILVVLLSVGYILYSVQHESQTQARKTIVIGLLCLISVAFWAFYFQMFLSLTLFLARMVQPKLFGIPFAPPYYVGIQSIGMILLGLILARQKHHVSIEQQGVRTGHKFVLAMISITLGYFLIALISNFSSPISLLSPLAIIPAYLLISLAELLLSPVGLSAITSLASPQKVSTMMGIFFVSLGVGAFLSGKLANLTAIPIGETSTKILKAHYATAFSHLLYILVGLTLLCFFLNVLIKYLLTKPIPQMDSPPNM